jgi:hypothetical protein
MSYTWRSILKGVEVIKMGLVWMIGDGEDVNIWRDPWLNRDGSKIPITPRRHNVITKVAELINPVIGTWDEQLIADIFCQEDARLIMSIPLREEMEDYPAWFPDPKGVFSVPPTKC